MPKEIERKYLVDAAWTPRDAGTKFQQGYLSSQAERVVRVRIEGTAAKLTIKGLSVGVTRAEYEYDIPLDDARELMTLCEQPLIDKVRHVETHAGKTWEIDVFHGDNEGLVVAEIELDAEGDEIEPPPWLGQEVSSDARYYNANLIKYPFKTWATGR